MSVHGKVGVSERKLLMMDQIFDWCVQVLVYWANVIGITYKEINVWVFVIIWPLLTVIMVGVIVIQRRKIRGSFPYFGWF